jgi:hypothetical protein
MMSSSMTTHVVGDDGEDAVEVHAVLRMVIALGRGGSACVRVRVRLLLPLEAPAVPSPNLVPVEVLDDRVPSWFVGFRV